MNALHTIDKFSFEEKYISVRLKEQRLYTDEELALLPHVLPDHIHYNEWQIRKRSAERLIQYLSQKPRPLKILEVGCGNGWLSAKLAQLDNVLVTGIDISSRELQQAATVFRKNNINFIYGDINDLLEKTYDIIVFAASIQYFSSLAEIIETAISLLNKDGEIHIIDTSFYKDDEVISAAERTKSYYEKLGDNNMSDHYFHHTLNVLKNFNYKILFSGRSFKNKVLRRTDPFPWIKIIK